MIIRNAVIIAGVAAIIAVGVSAAFVDQGTFPGMRGNPVALQAVARAAGFLESKVAGGEPLYGISTGFGSNANKLLAGAGREDLDDVGVRSNRHTDVVGAGLGAVIAERLPDDR